jgi:DNA (cytosine-5)-methyltransferase 1
MCATSTSSAESADLQLPHERSDGRPSDSARSTHSARSSSRSGLVVSAGFPCQDISPAGKRSGLRGSQSSLAFRPDWLVIENSFHRWRAWVPELRSELHRRGYSSVPFRVLAADVGAVHKRARCWLVAHTDSEQLRELSRWWHGPGREVASELAKSWDSAPRRLGEDDGLSGGMDRRAALGNAVVPAAAEVFFRGITAVCSGHSDG